MGRKGSYGGRALRKSNYRNADQILDERIKANWATEVEVRKVGDPKPGTTSVEGTEVPQEYTHD